MYNFDLHQSHRYAEILEKGVAELTNRVMSDSLSYKDANKLISEMGDVCCLLVYLCLFYCMFYSNYRQLLCLSGVKIS